MSPQQHLAALLRDGEQGATLHTLANPWNSRRKFASFAFVAEQYGYAYSGLSPQHSVGRSLPVFAFRRLPDAVERAVRTCDQHPQALHGGALPGMRPGGDGLAPLPESRHRVDLLHACIKVDLFGTSRSSRVKAAAVVVPIGVLIAIALTVGINITGCVVAACICAGWWLYLWLATSIMRRSLMRYTRKLDQAGVRWPPNGR